MFCYKVFKSNENCYLYDGNTGNILLIDEEMFQRHEEAFKSYITNDGENVDLCEQIQEAVEAEAIVENDEEQRTFEYWFDEREYLETFWDKVDHLMISITEKCNMRCKYCCYGGHYAKERVHSQNDIDELKLFKTLDFFLEHQNKNNEPVINFYGGEPFMNIAAIKRVIDYVICRNSRAKFYITSNATLLNGDNVDFFISNKNLHIYVSIAGTPNIHDKVRVLANGEETFDTIQNNLMYIKRNYSADYKNRIHFLFNLFSESQLVEIKEFWETSPLFEDYDELPEITMIDCQNDDGAVKTLKIELINDTEEDYSKLLDRYVDLLKAKDYHNVIVKFFDNRFIHLHRRSYEIQNVISGVCKPYVKKIFVDVSGYIHPCENFMINEYSDDIEEMQKVGISMLNRYKEERNKTCGNCWAKKICTLCYRDVINKHLEVDNQKTVMMCNHERKYLQGLLSEYCYIMEQGEDLFDHLDDYILGE